VQSLERTPAEKERRAGLEETLYYELGQFDRLRDAYHRRLALLSSSVPQIQVVRQISNSEYLLYAAEAGVGRETLAQIDSLQATVQEPWSLFLESPAVRILLDMGDAEAARARLASGRRLLDAFGSSRFREAQIAVAEGRIAELEDGDCRRALDSYDRALEQNSRNRQARLDRLRCLTRLERWEDAQSDADWLLEQAPSHAKFLLAVARLDAARGDRGAAIGRLEKAVEVWAQTDADYQPAAEARELLDRLRGA